MTPEQLREACVMAGLSKFFGYHRVHRSASLRSLNGPWVVRWVSPEGSGDWAWLNENNPALRAYVASLLVAKVREQGDEFTGYILANSIQFQQDTALTSDDVVLATDEQRISSAMEVLTQTKESKC